MESFWHQYMAESKALMEPAEAPATDRRSGSTTVLNVFDVVSILISAQLYPASYAPRLTPPEITSEAFIFSRSAWRLSVHM
jgi:hypothetical protein